VGDSAGCGRRPAHDRARVDELLTSWGVSNAVAAVH
jgi:hypothetical protein